MINYQEALNIVLEQATLSGKEKCAVSSSLSRISVADVASPLQLPSFRNSAMDGFAVHSLDIALATARRPVTLPIVRKIAAGDIPRLDKESGKPCAVHIMTGALVPEGYDAVIPVEDASMKGDGASFARPASINENVRFPGEDVKQGQLVLRKGETITAEKIMLLSAIGLSHVEVCQTPKLHIFSTGNEITDEMRAPLPEGKIYNSNAPFLMARCEEEGLSASYGGIIADDAQQFEQALLSCEAGSVIVSTGAVSKGEWDFIPESLKRLGAKVHFHRVSIKPGKPILFAALPNGSRFFGLPGNPVSSAVGFRFFVLPLLRALQGLNLEEPLIARLENDFVRKGNLRHFLKAKLSLTPNGELVVSINKGQESFKIGAMAEGNAWAILVEGRWSCNAGEQILVLPYQSRQRDLFPNQSEGAAVRCKAA